MGDGDTGTDSGATDSGGGGMGDDSGGFGGDGYGGINGSDSMSDGFGDAGGIGAGGFGGGDGSGFGDGFGGMPDVGTLGGTFSDGWGENSSTLGGFMSDAQADANAQAADVAGISPYGAPEEDSFFGKLSKGYLSLMQNPAMKGISTALSIVSPQFGLANMFANMAANINQGKGGQALGGMFGNAVQGMFGAPGQIANTLGFGLGPAMSNAVGAISAANPGQMGQSNYGEGTTSVNGSNGSSTDWGQILPGLAGMYMANRGASAAGNQASSLGSMYSANSPYAKQLEQALARRDAASGRRSQYGPRAVELQAKLAAMANGVAPNILAANNSKNYNNLYMVSQLAKMFGNGAFNGLGNSLSGLFGGNSGGGDTGGFGSGTTDWGYGQGGGGSFGIPGVDSFTGGWGG